MDTKIFDLVTLTLEFELLFEIFNFVNNIWILRARALIFHMSIPLDKIFLLVLTFWPWNLTFFFLIDIGHYFLNINIRAFILHTVISCDKIFSLVSKYMSLWSWPSLELAIIGGIWVSQTHLVSICI
mgnify:CR=1 FL=1